MILEVFALGPAETNAYLLGCPQTKRAVVIDAPFDSCKILIKRSKELDLRIEMILLTHSHWDHIAEAALLKEALQVPIYIHKDDADNLERPGSDRLPMFLPVKGVKPDGYLDDGRMIAL